MPIRRDTRTGRWFFRTTVQLPDGRRRRVSGTPGCPGSFQDLPNTKIGAQEAERRAIAAALKPDTTKPTIKPKEVPTLNEYAQTFIECYRPADKPSAKLARRQLLRGYILKSMGRLRLDEIQQRHLDKLVAEVLPGRSRKTVNNITAVLSSLMRYAARNKLIQRDQIEDLQFEIKSQDSEIVAVAAADVRRLVAAASDQRYRVAVLLAADAGLRVGEIRALTWKHLNELAREVTVSQSFDRSGELTETKGWKSRVVPISDRLWEALRALPRSSVWVIAKLNSEGPLRYDAIREGIHRLYKKAEVSAPSKPWHSLRHTFGTELASAGVPVHTIQALMGHSVIETTLRYMHTDRAAKRDAIDSLWQPGGSTHEETKKNPAK